MFISETDISEVYVRISPVDFRKGLVGLCSEVLEAFTDDASRSRLFVFTNRSQKMVRILYWDKTGFAYWHKRLEKSRFAWPCVPRDRCDRAITVDELKWLLSGVDIDRLSRHPSLQAKSFQ